MFVVLLVIIIPILLTTRLIKNKIRYKVKYRIVTGYLIVLFGITLIYISFIQPKRTYTSSKNLNVPFLFELINETEDEVVLPEEYKLKEWEISSDIKELSIDAVKDYEGFWIDIIVDYDDAHTGKLILYETPTTISGIDISEYVPLKEIKVDGDTITISDDYVEVNSLAIKNEMTLNQFKHGPNNSLLDSFAFHHGEQVLYLELPTDVKVNADKKVFNIIYK